MKSGGFLLCPAQDINHPSVRHTHATHTPCSFVTEWPSWLSDLLSRYHSACVQITLILLMIVPFLVVIVVNLLLCLIYKLNVIRAVYV